MSFALSQKSFVLVFDEVELNEMLQNKVYFYDRNLINLGKFYGF